MQSELEESKEFFTGKLVTTDVLLEWLKLVKAFVILKGSTSNSSYSASLAVGFLFDFFSPHIKALCIPNGLSSRVQNSDTILNTLELSSK